MLTAMREVVCEEARDMEAKATVSGEHGRYTVHGQYGLHDVNAHCKWCARVDFLETMDEELGPERA